MHDLSEVNASRIIEGLEKMRAEASRAMGSRIERDLGEVDQMLIVFHRRKPKEKMKEDPFIAANLTFNWKVEKQRVYQIREVSIDQSGSDNRFGSVWFGSVRFGPVWFSVG